MTTLALLALLGLPQEAKVTYKDHVLPIFQNHCLACHDSEKRKGDLDLSTYPATIAGGSSGDSVAPGDGVGSLLYKTVAHLEDPKMPPKKPKIPETEILLIRKWIDGGLLETGGSVARKGRRAAVDLAGAAPAVRVKPEGPPAFPAGLLMEPVKVPRRPEALTALASSPWAPLVAFSSPYQVLLYHAETLEFAGLLPFPERNPRVLRFSRDGAWLLAGGGQEGKRGRVVVWDVKTGDRVLEAGEETDVVLAADLSSDRRLVALGGPQKLVKILDARDGELIHTIKKHTDWVTALEFSPDAGKLATGDRAGGLHVWDSEGRILFTLNGHKGAVTGVAWRADSRILASSSEDGQVMLWEMEGGTRAKAWNAHPGGVLALDIAENGGIVTCGRNHRVSTWSPDGTKLKDFPPFPDLALQTVYSHDAKRVIAGDWTGIVRVFKAEDGSALGDLEAVPPTLARRLASDEAELGHAREALAKAEAAKVQAETASKAASEGALRTKQAAESEAAKAGGLEKRIAAAAEALAAARKAHEEARKGLTARQADAAREAQEVTAAQGVAQKAREELRSVQEAAAALLKELEADPAKAAELEKLQKSASDKTGEVARASDALQKAQVEAEVAANAIGPAKQALDKAQAVESKAETSLASLNSELDGVRKASVEAAKAQIEAEKAAAAAGQTLASALQERDAARARQAALDTRLLRWRAEQFNVEVHARKAETDKVKAQHQALVDALEGAREAAQEVQERAVQAGKAVDAADARVKVQEAALVEARKGPWAAEEALRQARTRKAEKETLASRAAALAAPIEEAAKAEAGNASLTQAAAKTREAVEWVRKDVAAAQQDLVAAEAAVPAARAAVLGAEQALEAAGKAASDARKKAAELAEASKAAQSKVASEQAKVDAFKPTLDAALGELEKLRAEYRKRLGL
jgi:hypothetical protein